MAKSEIRQAAKVFLQQLRRAVVALRSYAPEHPMSQERVREAANALFDFTSKYGDLLFFEARGRIMVNDVHLDPDPLVADKLTDDLVRAGLTSLKLGQALTGDEFAKICEFLAMNEDKLERLGGLSQALAEQGITAVEVNGMKVVLAGEPMVPTAATSGVGLGPGGAVTPPASLDPTSFVPYLAGAAVLPQSLALEEVVLPERFAAYASPAARMLSAAAGHRSQGGGERAWTNGLLASLRQLSAVAAADGSLTTERFVALLAPVLIHLPAEDQLRMRNELNLPPDLGPDGVAATILTRVFDHLLGNEIEQLCRAHPAGADAPPAANRILARTAEPDRICEQVRQRLADAPAATQVLAQLQQSLSWQGVPADLRTLLLLPPEQLWEQDPALVTTELTKIVAAEADGAALRLFQTYFAGVTSRQEKVAFRVAANVARVYSPLVRTPRFDAHCLKLNDRLGALPAEQPRTQVTPLLIRCVVDIARLELELEHYPRASRLLAALNLLPTDTHSPIGQVVIEEKNRLFSRQQLEQLIITLTSNRLDPASPEVALLTGLPTRAATALVARLADEQDRVRRGRLVELLKLLGAEAVPPLVTGLSDERWFVARNAARVLGDLRAGAAVPYLERILRHPEARVRMAVVRALGHIGTPQAMALVRQDAVDDSDGEIREEAKRIIHRSG